MVSKKSNQCHCSTSARIDACHTEAGSLHAHWTVKCNKDLSGWTVTVNSCVLSLAELASYLHHVEYRTWSTL